MTRARDTAAAIKEIAAVRTRKTPATMEDLPMADTCLDVS
jgi:hypothetical protein